MALLAAGADFEVGALDLFAGEARTPTFLRLNPFGTVPVLEEGGTVIAETGAILLHVAERFPAAGLLPGGAAARAQALRWLFHVAALHADFMTWGARAWPCVTIRTRGTRRRRGWPGALPRRSGPWTG